MVMKRNIFRQLKLDAKAHGQRVISNHKNLLLLSLSTGVCQNCLFYFIEYTLTTPVLFAKEELCLRTLKSVRIGIDINLSNMDKVKVEEARMAVKL